MTTSFLRSNNENTFEKEHKPDSLSLIFRFYDFLKTGI